MKRAIRYAFWGVLAAVLAAGCAARKPAFEGLYADLAEKPASLDASVLAGRRIVIDPGHGGAIGGTVGVDSLREADANLGVALYLWGLCADAGADVSLTRTADRDFLPPGSTNPGDDLKARVERSNAADPDAFISIHHNSNLERDRDLNRIEVYYRSDDPGASLELARDIETHLARNLGIETSEVRPGNYFVLRSSNARAAVLGEASFLSHPGVEGKLKLSAKQKLEAQAYFLGLVSYFSRGVPMLERITPERDTLTAPADLSFRVHTSLGVPIDPASVAATIGASRVVPSFDGGRSVLRFPMSADLPNGFYTVQASVRSERGASARSAAYRILLARPARRIIPAGARRALPSTVALAVKVLDELGAPVADGTAISVLPAGGASPTWGECRNGIFTIEVQPDAARNPFIFWTAGTSDTIRFPLPPEEPAAALVMTDARSRAPVPGVEIVRGASPSIVADSEGRALVPLAGAADTLLAFAAGYVPSIIDSASAREPFGIRRIELEPLFGGALAARKIAIDPGAGGSDSGGVGASRLRGASVNLEAARQLRDILVKGGASVTLTREGDETVSPAERVYIVNRSGAELAISVRHDAPGSDGGSARTILHYPGSERGANLAGRLAEALSSLPPGGPFAVREASDMFLTHTSCVACILSCGSVEEERLEPLMADPGWTRIEAEKMCAGIVRFLGSGAPSAFTEFRITATVRGGAAAGAAIDVDNIFIRSADASGSAVFSCITPGRHLITVRTKDGRTERFPRTIEALGPAELAVDLP